MSMIACKECGKQISSDAKNCPHCGKQNKKKGYGCGLFLIVGLFIFFFVPLMSTLMKSPEEPNAWMAKDNTSMAYIMAQDFVETSLKAPSTAKFPSSYDGPKIIKLKNHQYRVEAWVDAQNSFGAMIRTRFTCVVKQIDKDNWRLISLKTHK